MKETVTPAKLGSILNFTFSRAASKVSWPGTMPAQRGSPGRLFSWVAPS